MNPTRWLVLLMALLLTLEPARAQGQDPVLTLDEAVAIALEGNRKVQAARLAVERNDHLLHAAEAQRLPNFNLQVNHQEQLQDQAFVFRQGSLGTYSIGPIPSQDMVVAVINGGVTTLQAQVTQPLTGLYKLNLGVDLQQAELEVARQDELRQSLQTRLDVRSAYYAMLDSQNALAAAQDGVEFLRELERVVGEFVKEKVSLKADLLDVRARRLNAQAQALQLRNALDSQREQLNLLLGRDLATRFRVVNPLDASRDRPHDLPLQQLQQAAARQRPELRQAELRVQQAEHQRDLKAADWIPDVNLAFQYQRYFDSGILPSEVVSVGLQAEWEPWDWGRRDHQALAQADQVEEARRQQADARDQVVLEVNSKHRRLAELRAGEAAARVTLEAAEERLRVATNRFVQKAALSKDVLDAQSQLSQAQRDYHKVLLDYAAAEAELERAVGGPLSPEPQPATAPPGPATAPPGPATAPPGPATAPPGPATAPPGPAAAPPGPATAPPGPAAAPPGPATLAPAPGRPTTAAPSGPVPTTTPPAGPASSGGTL